MNSILVGTADNIGGLLPASKAEFRRVDAENAALKAQNTALSSRDDQLEKTVDSLCDTSQLPDTGECTCAHCASVDFWLDILLLRYFL